jgi:hypothetical protein
VAISQLPELKQQICEQIWIAHRIIGNLAIRAKPHISVLVTPLNKIAVKCDTRSNVFSSVKGSQMALWFCWSYLIIFNVSVFLQI